MLSSTSATTLAKSVRRFPKRLIGWGPAVSPALAACAAKVLLKKAARCRCHGSWRRRVWAGGKGWWWTEAPQKGKQTQKLLGRVTFSTGDGLVWESEQSAHQGVTLYERRRPLEPPADLTRHSRSTHNVRSWYSVQADKMGWVISIGFGSGLGHPSVHSALRFSEPSVALALPRV